MRVVRVWQAVDVERRQIASARFQSAALKRAQGSSASRMGTINNRTIEIRCNLIDLLAWIRLARPQLKLLAPCCRFTCRLKFPARSNGTGDPFIEKEISHSA